MALVTSKELLLNAQKGGYAVGAFNVENMEMVMAVLAAAEETSSLSSCRQHPAPFVLRGWITILQMYGRRPNGQKFPS